MSRLPKRAIVLAAIVMVLGLTVLQSRAADTITWKNLGPGGGGTMISMAIHPTNPNIILMGSDVGGIYLSEDGGVTWTLRNSPALVAPTTYANYGMHAGFGFDPENPEIVYAGMVYSNNHGLTWQLSSAMEANKWAAGGGVVDKDSPNNQIVFAFGWGFNWIWRTTDAWQLNATKSCLPTGACPGTADLIKSIVLDTNPSHHYPNPEWLLACADSGIYRTTDSAATWTKVALGLSNSSCNRLAISPSGRVFAVLKTLPREGPGDFSYLDAPWDGGVYRSDDFGNNWTEINGHDGPDLLATTGDFQGTANPDSSHPVTNWKYDGGADPNITQDCAHAHLNTCSLRFTRTPATFHTVLSDPPINVAGGELMKVTLWVSATSWSGELPLVNFRYRDGSDQPIELPDANGNIATVLDTSVSDVPQTQWRKFEALARVPDHARKVEVDLRTGDGTGMVWYDDVQVVLNNSLPHFTAGVSFASYADIAIDTLPGLNDLTLYVLTMRDTVSDFPTDAAGVWKTTDGGDHWTHVTRRHWHDNVYDEAFSMPYCGDLVCGGRWENCLTCPIDCVGPQLGKPTSGCCGNGVPESGETTENCLVDVPFDPEPLRTGYYETDSYFDGSTFKTYDAYYSKNGTYWAYSLAIGQGTTGHEVLLFGDERTKTIDGGGTWQSMHGTEYKGADSMAGTSQARGDATDIFVRSILTDSAHPSYLFYGDQDNRLQVSYNQGKSFEQEGWQWDRAGYFFACDGTYLPSGCTAPSVSIVGASPTSIIKGVGGAYYVGVYSNILGTGGGVVKGVGPLDPPSTCPCEGRWRWTNLGQNFPGGGQVDLVLRPAPSTAVFATDFGQGVYRLASEGDSWIAKTSNWSPAIPTGWKITSIAQLPDRVLVGAGDPGSTSPPNDLMETGVWESCDEGNTWSRLTNPDMDHEPVTSLLAVGSNTLFVTTSYAGSANPGEDGGIYRATFSSGCTGGEWTWAHVLHQPQVAQVVVSSSSPSIMYALVNQACCSGVVTGQVAGIYKSINSGMTASWSILANDGLMNIGSRIGTLGRLHAHAGDPKKLYVGSVGSGLFEGTVTCGAPIEGFTDTDSDGVADCSDTDDDNDGILDASDNCPTVANPGQENCDNDGQGNACDADDDNDGSLDTADCDDCNPAARPGLPEDCSDPADNDCNGVPDTSEPLCQANVAATIVTNGSTAATNKSCNLPAGIASGDLLLLALRSAGNDTHSTPSGWSQLVLNNTSDASDDRTSLWYKKANGTESSTVVINGTASLKFSCLSWRITGAADPAIQPPQVSTVATGTSTAPNPSALSPTGGTKLYLWIWLGGWEGKQTSPPAGNPTNYSSNRIGANTGTAGTTDTNCRLASETRNLNASSEDPGSWTISAADDWTAYTVAVHP